MLASDSDSDFEYPEGGDSGASSCDNEYGLLGKLALGLDPQDMKAYDGRSTPQNGSQYLMKVMSEKKVVPKVVCADVSKIVLKKLTKDENAEMVKPSYLDRFLQRCNLNESKCDEDDINSSLLPSSKWREETIANFSAVRSRIERWRHKIESGDKWLDSSVIVPESNDNLAWLKFCFGHSFVKVAISSKTKSEEQKLADFFLDLYDSSINELLEDRQLPVDSVDNIKAGGDGNLNENVDQSSSSTLSDVEKETKASTDENVFPNLEKYDQSNGPVLVLGHRPLMNVVMKLHQGHLENLIKWNLLWVTTMGFVNECQGQWLYAILACIHKPIDPSVMSDIRGIARKLIKVRNSMSMWNTPVVTDAETDGSPSKCLNSSNDAHVSVDEKVPNFINTLNLFIYIISDYLDQKDLIMKL